MPSITTQIPVGEPLRVNDSLSDGNLDGEQILSVLCFQAAKLGSQQ